MPAFWRAVRPSLRLPTFLCGVSCPTRDRPGRKGLGGFGLVLSWFMRSGWGRQAGPRGQKGATVRIGLVLYHAVWHRLLRVRSVDRSGWDGLVWEGLFLRLLEACQRTRYRSLRPNWHYFGSMSLNDIQRIRERTDCFRPFVCTRAAVDKKRPQRRKAVFAGPVGLSVSRKVRLSLVAKPG